MRVLVVRIPFGEHGVGDIIEASDPRCADILSGPNALHVVMTEIAVTPEPTQDD